MKHPPRLCGWVFDDADAMHNAIAQVSPSLEGGNQGVGGVRLELFPIATCQRHELFVLSNQPLAAPASVSRTFESGDAALRLFEIASGVLSDVPGEEAIALQVKYALRSALREKLAGTTLAKLARRALLAGEALRQRVRESTPIIELPELLPPLIEGRVILLGAGTLGRSIQAAFTDSGNAPAIWATRTPRTEAQTTIPQAIQQLCARDTLISALASVNEPLQIDVEGVHVIDLSDRPSVQCAMDRLRQGNVWALEDVIERSRDRLLPQAEAVGRAAHRLPALAEAALAECICPAIKSLNRTISAFKTNIVDAELKRLATLLASLDPAQAEIVRRSIQHAAARSAHPLHEYVNALGRQGRADDAQLLIDHILGSRVGIESGSMGVPARNAQPSGTNVSPMRKKGTTA